MKIMFYINTISYGGAERVIVNLARQFVDKSFEVILVTSYSRDQEYEVDERIKRYVLLDNENYGFVKKNIKCVKKIRELLKVENPDILVSFMAEPNFRAVVACLGKRTKTIVSVRNDPNKEYPNLLFRLCARILYRFADGVVFQTEDAKKWFPKNIQRKSRIIFNQVDEAFYNSKFAGERSGVVTTGRLTLQKNHKLLIHAFASIADKIEDNLVIYGEGELRAELERLISELHLEERIYLPGRTKNVVEAIKSARLFVLSSDYEGMPNALLEAMALGIPCVSTDCPCGGPKMLFGNRAEDRLVPCGNVLELSRAMEKILTDDSIDGSLEKEMSERFRPDVVHSEWNNYISFVEGKK